MKRHLAEGKVVLPAPLQVFPHRDMFKNTKPEQLYVNYCLQPENSDMLFFPYGPAVGAINHSKKLANVRFQWSSHALHRADILEMNYRQFWEKIYPGALILEVVALRDLHPGEELFLDYGSAWEEAWETHVDNWEPPVNAADYVYPEDMDETETLRTVVEQQTDPYPQNLITMCATPDHERKKSHIDWYEPDGEMAEYFVYCHILEKHLGAKGDVEYNVALIFFKHNNRPFRPEEFEFDPAASKDDLYVSACFFWMCVSRANDAFIAKDSYLSVPPLHRLIFLYHVGQSDGRKNHTWTMNIWRMLSDIQLAFLRIWFHRLGKRKHCSLS